MSIPFLAARPKYFPHPEEADETGLIAVSRRLDVLTVPQAYRCGLFPWYMEDYPVLWYHTSPRAVLFPEDLIVTKSMRKVLRDASWSCTINRAFSEVIHCCRTVSRDGQEGSWIHDEMEAVYNQLHEMGLAHSVEVWEDGDLIGGLYGIALGKIFHGESMFARKSNASKYGFIHLVHHLARQHGRLIDCQQDTDHLRSLGSTILSREDWLEELKWNSLEDDQAMDLRPQQLTLG